MNGLYMVKWGDHNRPDQRFYLTFNEAACKGPHFTFTFILDKKKDWSCVCLGIFGKWFVKHW